MSDESEVQKSQGRVFAIDALRGFDMFWITGGREFVLFLFGAVGFLLPGHWYVFLQSQLSHVPWGEPLVFWDLIMPLFLFIVGAAMPFSFERRVESGVSHFALYKKIIRRVIILWILGMIAQGNLLECAWGFITTFSLSAFDDLHLYSNTLQAIAAGYAITAVLMLYTEVRGQVIAFFLLLIGFSLLLTYVPVPEQGAGLLQPHANLAMYVDEALLQRFRDGTQYTWILSSMGFGATVLLGSFSGRLLNSRLSRHHKLTWLIILGAACILAGGVWSVWHPIIKYIWTSSMVLWTGGWCFLLLALFYWLIDIRRRGAWAAPFKVLGANAIVAYMIGELLGPVAWILCYLLYRRKIFVRI